MTFHKSNSPTLVLPTLVPSIFYNCSILPCFLFDNDTIAPPGKKGGINRHRKVASKKAPGYEYKTLAFLFHTGTLMGLTKKLPQR